MDDVADRSHSMINLGSPGSVFERITKQSPEATRPKHLSKYAYSWPESSWPEVTCLHHNHPKDMDTVGRITMSLAVFTYIGGYDKETLPCDYQDRDLVLRAGRLGEAVKVVSAEMVWAPSLVS